MAKLKLDKDSLQSFFFNHTEKIVLAVVLLLLGLFIWSGSSLEGIGAQNPAELATKVDSVAQKIEQPTWDNIKDQYTPSLDHGVRIHEGNAPTSESYYPLDTPLIGSPPNSATPRQDPELFAVTDVQATIVSGAIAVKSSPKLTDPFADLDNMEQKKIEAPKKKKKKKKQAGGSGESMYGENMGMFVDEEGAADESAMAGSSMYGEGMYGEGGMMGGAVAGPVVRADGDKFHGYRPTATQTATGNSVVGVAAHVVSVRGLVPYQQQWDEFERVFEDAAGYVPSRDIPRYLSFRAQRAEVPSDPNAPLNWGYVAWTERVLDALPKMGWAGFPGELADSKYLLPGVLTMPVPPLMMRDLRPLALHSKVPIQEEVKAPTVERATPERIGLDEVGEVADIDDLPTAPGARRPVGGAEGMYGGEGMYGSGGADMYGSGREGMYGSGGEGMYGGGMSTQLVRGPQAEFLMVRFFDYIKPGKKYVYRIQVVLEDPNHPQSPSAQPIDRSLADVVRTRLAKVAEDEAKQTAAKKTPVRLYTVTSEWSEATAPVFVETPPETYAGGVTLPRMLDIVRGAEPNLGQKSGYALPLDGEPTAEVMDLSWDPKYATDLPSIVPSARGTLFEKPITANVIDPVSLVYKTIPDYALKSGEIVLDIRGGEVLEPVAADAAADAKPLLTPGEVALINANGELVVRNELDDWQIFDRLAPPPAIVVESSPSAGEGYGADAMDYGSAYGGFEGE